MRSNMIDISHHLMTKLALEHNLNSTSGFMRIFNVTRIIKGDKLKWCQLQCLNAGVSGVNELKFA